MNGIYAYKNGSKSAKLLKEALGIPLLKHEGKPVRVDTVINWGSSDLAERVRYDMILNHPTAVNRSANKLHSFKAFDEYDVPCPTWTASKFEARDWVGQGVNVFARTLLNSHSGRGIVDIQQPEDFVEAPLYTQYVKKKNEYRIHVFGGHIIHVQRKARKKEIPDEEVNWKIRNHDNGFIFQMNDVEVPEEAKGIAINAVIAVGLDFGAVDIIESARGNWLVLEVNSAPGIEGTTLERYVEAFKEVL